MKSYFSPNWASPPGDTINAVLKLRGLSLDVLSNAASLSAVEAAQIVTGARAIDQKLAIYLAATIGSTPKFWLERERQFRATLNRIRKDQPELQAWFNKFPLRLMVEKGWVEQPESSQQAPFNLLDFFDVENVEEWRSKYASRLGSIKFRTSASFQNDVATTSAWIRRGELLAEAIPCAKWDREGFSRQLIRMKQLTLEADPKLFLPALTEQCAAYGVRVVVVRSIKGCAASGATCIENDKALMLLSARFLSDDQFWFSFFHEAGHLVLHGHGLVVEGEGASSPEQEAQADQFARRTLLDPESSSSLSALALNRFSIARFARHCGISRGIVVGMLQHDKRIGQGSYQPFKVRYKINDLSRETA